MTGLRISSALAFLVLVPLRAGAQDVPVPVRTAAACAPVGSPRPSNPPRVAAPDSVTKTLFTVGEVVAIDRGTDEGLRPGQRYLVRRPMSFQGAPRAQYTIGRLRVTDATPTTATAVIEVTCDAITVGDHLEPFRELTLPPESTRTFVGGSLDRERTIRVSYGGDGRSLFGDADFILAEGGVDQGVAPGARYAALRRGSDSDATPLSEAVVVAVFEGQSLLRFTGVRDPMFTGDVLALRVGARDPGAAAERRASTAGAADPPARPAVPDRAGRSGVTVSTRSADEGSARTPQRSLTFEEVHFALNRSALRPEAHALLDEAVTTLRADPTLRVQIEGYTCDLGTPEYNLALGQRRADAVREYLLAKGVAGERLTTVSYGEEKPAHDNSNPETRNLNRRAVLVVSIQTAGFAERAPTQRSARSR